VNGAASCANPECEVLVVVSLLAEVPGRLDDVLVIDQRQQP